ncbi:MAG: ABC transporter substrate-binding protein [Chloroflexi bacterium]|nr:ABC transporter substrate-binding protein [Chloroflexota bacterium]
MTRSKLLVSVVWLTVLGLLLAACAPAAAPQPSPAPKAAAPQPTQAAKPTAPGATPKPSAAEPRYGGILSVSDAGDPPNYDIYQTSNIVALQPLAPAYNALVHYDLLEPTKIIGDLARDWELSPDGKTYTFRLQSGVKWHDGKPFTAEDARFSLELIKDPPRGFVSARKDNMLAVNKIEAPDSTTIKIVMKYPYLSFMAQFATDWFVITPKHVLEAKGDMKKDVVGTGPFKFKSYSPGSSLELVKNPDYFVKGRPYLDGITTYIIKDVATHFAAFRTGRIKLTGRSTGMLTASHAEVVQKDQPDLKLWRYSVMQSPWFHFNTTTAPFNDVRVRRAVALSFDRQAAIKTIAQGMATVSTFLPPGQWSIPAAEVLKLPGYRQPKDQDIADAKKLVADAGHAGGLKVSLLTREDQTKAAEFARAQVAAIGIDLTVETAERAVLDQRVSTQKYTFAVQSSVYRINDPDELSRKWLSDAAQNYGKWKSERFDKLFVEQSQTLDAAKRKAMVRELDQILLEEWPSILPYWSDSFVGSWPEVRNVGAPGGMYSSLRNQDIWLAK